MMIEARMTHAPGTDTGCTAGAPLKRACDASSLCGHTHKLPFCSLPRPCGVSMELSKFLLFVEFVLLVDPSTLATGRRLQQNSCPINPEQRKLDFSGVPAGCGQGKDPCTSCVCAINNAFVPAFQAANMTYNPQKPSSATKKQADELLKVCTPAYLLQITMAGVKIDDLIALQNCPANANPPCLTAVFEKLTPKAKVAAAAAPKPQLTGVDKAVGKVQGAMANAVTAEKKVEDAGRKVADSGRSAVNAMKSAANSIRDLFRG